jgi:hypothetical protein
MKALTDMQCKVLDAGKALAEELGLTLLPRLPLDNIELNEGQTILVVTPQGMNLGIIRVTENKVNRSHITHYLLNGTCLLMKTQRYQNDEWIPVFGPEMDLRFPMESIIYVS